MTLEDRIRNHMNAGPDSGVYEPDVKAIVKAGNRRRTRNKVGAAIAGGVLALGAVFGTAAILQNGSESELATNTLENSTTSTTAPVETPSTDDPPAAAGGDFDTSLAGLNEIVIGSANGFVGLRFEGGRVLAIESSDGLEWSDTPTVGLPTDVDIGSGRLVQADDGRYVAVLDSFPSASADDLFDTTQLVGVSDDLIEWSYEFVDFSPITGSTGFSVGFDVLGDDVMAIFDLFENFTEPTGVLLDLGVLTAEQFETSCGYDYRGPGEPFAVLSCELVEDFESPEGIPNYEGALLVLNPGDLGYDEAVAAYDSRLDGPAGQRVAVRGPIGGPYEIAADTIPLDLVHGFRASNGRWIALGSTGSQQAMVTSANGVDWQSGDQSITGDFFEIGKTNEGTLIRATTDGDRLIVARSVDGGQSWPDSIISLDAPLFSGFAMTSDGVAGTALLLTGSPTDFSDEFQIDSPPVVIEMDGFEITFDFTGPLWVRGPDGALIHEINDWVTNFDTFGGEEGVYRFQGENDETLIFLDPETGDPLVTVTEDDFNDAFEQVSPDFSDSGPSGLSNVTSILYFSTDDGVTWIELAIPEELTSPGVTFSLLGVGDDEVVLLLFDSSDFAADFGEDGEPLEDSAADVGELSTRYVRIQLNP